eukprot:TRINITY_DN6051_c0_g2_i1.p3 TRINITY_DN6051_c0_g2~~TRINITY_DN6051_c0_g2_i1.p3  ORF type:complete len:175 (-),score=18.84 TRINITY_DN6051_c0_g2_i1:712-1236(-)
MLQLDKVGRIGHKFRQFQQSGISAKHPSHRLTLGACSVGIWGILAQQAQARASSGIHYKTKNTITTGNLMLCVSPSKTRRKRRGGGNNNDGDGNGGDFGGFGGGWWGGGNDDWFSDDSNWRGRGRSVMEFIWTLVCWMCFVQTIYFLLFVRLPKSLVVACLTGREVGLSRRIRQ